MFGELTGDLNFKNIHGNKKFYLGAGGSEWTETALYFSSLPSIISSTSAAFSKDTLDARQCWLSPEMKKTWCREVRKQWDLQKPGLVTSYSQNRGCSCLAQEAFFALRYWWLSWTCPDTSCKGNLGTAGGSFQPDMMKTNKSKCNDKQNNRKWDSRYFDNEFQGEGRGRWRRVSVSHSFNEFITAGGTIWKKW